MRNIYFKSQVEDYLIDVLEFDADIAYDVAQSAGIEDILKTNATDSKIKELAFSLGILIRDAP